jgi:predicted ATPase
VFFVDLSAITDPALVAPAIAQALEVPEEAGRPRLETLAAYLAERSSLLLLDNFEQVLSAAPAVEHLLTSALGCMWCARAGSRSTYRESGSIPSRHWTCPI